MCGGCAQLEAGVDVDHVLDHDGLAGQEALQHLAAVLLAQAGDLRTGQHEVTLPHGYSYVIYNTCLYQKLGQLSTFCLQKFCNK